MGLTTYPASGGAVWGDITGSVSAQTDLTTAFGTQGIKRYFALLTQVGTANPTATVLENSLGGTVVWTRDEGGIYFGTLAGVFTSAKTWTSPPSVNVVSPIKVYRSSDNVVTVETNSADDILNDTAIEILVYP